MEKPKSPHQEITSPDNADIHGNLRYGTWRGLQTLRARANFFKNVPKDDGLKFTSGEALETFCKDLIRTTGSIDGKHRDSTTQAVQGAKPATIALGAVQTQTPQGPVKL